MAGAQHPVDPATAAGDPAAPRGREELVGDAFAHWSAELAALGGRDPLLHFRDLKVGTLDLAAADPGARRRLLDGEPAPISKLFPHEPLRSSAQRSARSIRNKSRELAEERGLGVCLLAVGIATWSNPFAAHRPTAPVLLRRTEIVARDAAETDFMVTVAPEAIVNPVLLHALDNQLGLRFSPEELRDPNGELRYTVVVDRLREFAPPHVVDGFSVAHRAVLATFAVEPLVMADDLDAIASSVRGTELVAAMAGDDDARARLARSHQPKSGERTEAALNLVLDADSAQTAAVAAAAAGRSFLVDAPPGSGRTQTVANIVGELLTRRRSVLVVGQKQAALAEVARRLESAGLGDVVLDLPRLTPTDAVARIGNTARRLRDRPVAQAPVGAALEQAGAAEATLTRYRDALHRDRAPWGTSAHDAMTALATAPAAARTEARIPVEVLTTHDHATAGRIRADLREYAELGGFSAELERSAWHGAVLHDDEQAQNVGHVVVRLRERTLPALRDAVTRAAVEVGLPGPTSPAEAMQTVELLGEVEQAERTFGTTIWGTPLDDLTTATGSRAQRREAGSALGWLARRRLVRQARELAGSSEETRERSDLHAALLRARIASAEWTKQARDGRPPRVGPHLPQALEAAEATERRWTTLAEVTPRAAGLLTEPFEAVDRVLDELVMDEQRLFDRPRLLELERSLQDAHLGDLLTELRSRRTPAVHVAAAYDHARHASLLASWEQSDPDLGRFDRAAHEKAVASFREADARALREAAIGVVAARSAWFHQAVQTHPEQAQALLRAGVAPRPRTPRELLDLAPDVALATVPCWLTAPLAVPTWLPPRELFDTVVIEDAGRLPLAQAAALVGRARQVILVGDEHELTLTSFETAVSSPTTTRDPEGPWTAAPPESVMDALRGVLPTYPLSGQYRARDDRLVGFAARTTYAGRLHAAPGPGGSVRVRVERVVVPGLTNEVVLDGGTAVTAGSMTSGVDDGAEPVAAGAGTADTAADVEPNATGAPAEGAVDGDAREVDRVVDLVLAHYRERPHESLGVVTLTEEHAERVEAAVRRELVHAPDVAALLQEDADEAFFVKDVDRIAGDVRDAVVLSLGYGRSSDGRVLYRFGALDRPGGEHRVAAATTRSRERLSVVTSFGSEQLSDRRLVTDGALALRDFLAFAEQAESGRRLEAGTDGAADHPDGAADVTGGIGRDALAGIVAERLRAAGAVVAENLGEGPGAVPVAVRHPSRPDRYVLAVETDGPGYAAMDTARERDRIREAQLRRLGWSVYRVWSPAWGADPEAETARLLAACDDAIQAADAYDWALAAVDSDDTVGLDEAQADESVPAARAGADSRAETGSRPGAASGTAADPEAGPGRDATTRRGATAKGGQPVGEQLTIALGSDTPTTSEEDAPAASDVSDAAEHDAAGAEDSAGAGSGTEEPAPPAGPGADARGAGDTTSPVDPAATDAADDAAAEDGTPEPAATEPAVSTEAAGLGDAAAAGSTTPAGSGAESGGDPTASVISDQAPDVELDRSRAMRHRSARPSVRPGGSVSAYTGPELVALARWYESDGRIRELEPVITGLAEELRLAPDAARTRAVLRHATRVARAGTTGPTQ